jgi:Activator of Hsp90 ATPase homolog 1-like protein
MTDRSATAEVEVTADADRAFAAFTEEIDSWWVRGAINFFDAARAVEMKIEPGVDGRVLEVYEGDALELGRITVWEPGTRLAYRSSVDDSEVDVRFEPVEGGTRVRVTQTLIPGGEKMFDFWPRVLQWFGSWFGIGRPTEIAPLSIALYYEKPVEAAHWLERVFQLRSWSGILETGEGTWIELHHGNVAILLFEGDGVGTDMPWVYVEDLDAHFEHARSEGATIVSEIHQQGYRAYEAEDLEGRRWTFAQARPTMSEP